MLEQFEDAQKILNASKSQEVNKNVTEEVVVLNNDLEVVDVVLDHTEASVIINDTEIPTTEEALEFAKEQNKLINEELKEVEDGLTLGEFIYETEVAWKEKQKAKEDLDELSKIEESLPDIIIDDLAKEEDIQNLTEEIATEMKSDISVDKKVENIVSMFMEEKAELLLEAKLQEKRIEILWQQIVKLQEEIVSLKYNDTRVSIDDDNLGFLINAYKEFKTDSKDVKKAEKLWNILTKHLTTIYPEITWGDVSDIITTKRQNKINQLTGITGGGDNTLSSNTKTQPKTKELTIKDFGYMVN